MGRPAGSEGPGGWVGASDLAEYVYCPRAQWYRHHPEEAVPSIESERRRAAGRRYHAEFLAAEQRRGSSSALLWVLFALGLLCLLAAAVVGAGG